MEFSVLGPLRVVDGGREIALRSQKQRALLAFLLLHAGEVVSTDRLLDELWGERPPPTARNSLQNQIHQLRKALGADVLRTRPPGYVLDVEPETVDATRFVRQLAAAHGEPASERAETLRKALALWHGRALADLEFEQFALAEAPRLNELRATAEEDLVAAELELGRHAEVVARLEGLVREHPLRERLHGQLMLALYRSGRQGDALGAFRSVRRTLVEELGVEPGQSLRVLEGAILRQDPALDAPVAEGGSALDLRERRAAATVLFVALDVPSELDPERHRALTAPALHELRAAAEYHGGTVERLAGDELVAVFGVPARHEDDPLRAVRAALQIARALDRAAAFQLRIALDTGEVIAPVAGARAPVAGAPLSAAKRLAEAAPPGVVVATAATHALVQDAVEGETLDGLNVRGQAAPVAAVRIDAVIEARTGRRLADTPFVGRTDELAALRAAYEDAVAGGRSVVLGVFGEAGLGKTRLAAELARSVADEADVAVGRCVSYGEGITWLPLRELIRSDGSVLTRLFADERDGMRAARILDRVAGGDDAPVSVQDVFWAARRFLEARARRRPLVVVLDDVHWAETSFVDFVEQIASSPADGPILVLALSRPELVETRPALRWLELRRLADDDVRTLVDAALVDPLSGDVRERVQRVAEGNPLFAEQLVAYAQERGADAVTSVPPTVEALLAARLDGVDADARAVVQRAAVVGREFWQTAVLHVTPELEVPAVGRHLEQLAAKGLIHRVTAIHGREDAFRFHHVLIRDVAYAATPKAERADLHEAVAEWLDASGDAEDEVVGYHLEQAYRARVEIGRRDRHARMLAADAGERLATAGTRSLKRADVYASANLLRRATDLLPRDRAAIELTVERAIAERATGRIDDACSLLEHAVAYARETGDRPLELRAAIELASIRLHTGSGDGRGREVLDLARTAIAVFEQQRHDRALGRAWLVIGDVEGALHGRMAAWADAAERAKTHYERAGWPPSICRSKIAAALYHGPLPATKAIRRCSQLALEAADDPFSEAGVLVFLGGLLGMRGKFSDARELLSGVRRTYEEVGAGALFLGVTDSIAAKNEMLAGKYADAEDILRGICDLYERLAEQSHYATMAGELAQALYARGALDEAREFSRRAAERATADDYSAQLSWRSVEAKLLARDGRFAEAEALARDAVGVAAATDALNRHATALLDLAEVVQLDGRAAESAQLTEGAIRLFVRKGNTAAARQVRKRMHLAPA